MHISRIKQWLKAISLILICLYLILSNSSNAIAQSAAPEAIASIHKYPEASTQVMYRSQQSLQDNLGKTWQAVLFKRVKSGQLESLHLRLVGFPGIAELAHPYPLHITANAGKIWAAKDIWTEQYLPINVGEYDLLEIISKLDQNTSLQLSLPLKNGTFAELLIPSFVVQEWKIVFDTH